MTSWRYGGKIAGMDVTLAVSELAIERDSTPLAADICFVVGPGDVVGLVGPNGCGKSTLLKVIAGSLPAAGGRVTTAVPAAIGLLAQDREHQIGYSVLGVAEELTGVRGASDSLEVATTRVATGDLSATASTQYDQALQAWLDRGGVDFEERFVQVAAQVGLMVDPAAPAELLSRGQAARLDLVGVLLSRFDILLLDEPTNDLDEAGLEWLEEFVRECAQPVVLVSHDREFLSRTVTGVVEFDPALETVAFFRGGFDSWVQERQHKLAAAEMAYQAVEAKRGALLAKADAARRSAERGSGSAKRKYLSGKVDKVTRGAMLDGATSGASAAGRLEQAADRLAPKRQPRKQWRLQLSFPALPAGNGSLASLSEAEVVRDDFKLGPISLSIYPGDRIELLGRNGLGKSTLLELLLGSVAPTSGSAQTLRQDRVGYLDQRRSLPPGKSLRSAVQIGLPDLSDMEVRTLLAKFGLTTQDLDKEPQELSWGERTRARLAILSAHPTQILVLDEPTNHLDLSAIEQLEIGLMQYRGAIVLATHDVRLSRAFVATRKWQLREVAGRSRLVESS
jgi:ATPase subunit of ABC transporter with duplicated ATPase domains